MPARKIKERFILYKNCFNNPWDLSVDLLAEDSCVFINICYEHDICCNMSKLCVKACVREAFAKSLVNEGMI